MESFERLPSWSVWPIEEIEDVQVVIAEQRPSAHSLRGRRVAAAAAVVRAASGGEQDGSDDDCEREDPGAFRHRPQS